MVLIESWPVAVAAAGMVGWFVYLYLVELMLMRFGTITRGTVLRATELGRNSGRGSTFIVSYEFAVNNSSGDTVMHRGRQWMTHGFRPKDMVVVRFLPRRPTINTIADRAV